MGKHLKDGCCVLSPLLAKQVHEIAGPLRPGIFLRIKRLPASVFKAILLE